MNKNEVQYNSKGESSSTVSVISYNIEQALIDGRTQDEIAKIIGQKKSDNDFPSKF